VRLVVVVATAAAGVAGAALLAGCGVSNQQRSARIAAQGQHLIRDQGTLKLDGTNADVRVERSAIVGANGSFAAAVELRNAGTRAQADVPVLIDVRDRRGASVYRNDAIGLQPSLQRVAVVPGGGRTWWVNDQLLGVDGGATVKARVGTAKSVGQVPDVTVRGVHFEETSAGPLLSGTVVNRSRTEQRNLPVFAVAVRGGKVVAAGRSLVRRLPVGRTRKPTLFRLYFLGDPQQAKIQVSLAPAVS
jgi:hypothetical protein